MSFSRTSPSRTALLVLAGVVMSTTASAAPIVNNQPASVSAKVTGIGTYGNGTHFIMFDRPIVDSACIASSNTTWNSRFNIEATNPALKTIIAMATLAMALDKLVIVHPSACDQNSANPSFPSIIWDTTGNSYMFIMN